MFVYVLQRLQGHCRLTHAFLHLAAPQNATPLTPDLAFNTAISLHYQHELAVLFAGYDRQLFGADGCSCGPELCVCRGGMAVAIALIRGFARHSAKTIGNFWADVTRALSTSSSYLHSGYGVLRFARCHQNFKGPRTQPPWKARAR